MAWSVLGGLVVLEMAHSFIYKPTDEASLSRVMVVLGEGGRDEEGLGQRITDMMIPHSKGMMGGYV